MDVAQHYKQHSPLETEDHVATFVENELGRLDWAANWSSYKVNYPDYLDRISRFFSQLGESVNPSEIAKFIDLMVITRPGPWK